jgi:hypothetical protein
MHSTTFEPIVESKNMYSTCPHKYKRKVPILQQDGVKLSREDVAIHVRILLPCAMLSPPLNVCQLNA